MKIKVLENEVLLISELTHDDYANVARYNPDALKLKDENGEEVFRVCADSHGGVSQYGVIFDLSRSTQKAVVKLEFDENEEITAETIVMKYGRTFTNLRIVEHQVKETKERMEDDIESWKDKIEFIEL